MMREEKTEDWFQPEEFVSQEKISHGFDNLSDYLPGETGAETIMGQWQVDLQGDP